MEFDADKYVTIARIGKPVGLSGLCRLFPFGVTLSGLSCPVTLFVGDEKQIEGLVLEELLSGNEVFRARFGGYTDRDQVDISLKNRLVYIEKEQLPKPEDGEFYFYDLIGLDVENENGKTLGKIVDVFNYPTTDALEIQLLQSNKKVVLPFRNETVPTVSLDEKKIIVDNSAIDELLS